jgi:DNA-directed RNA polymerase specialized sigma24 family protein
MTLLNKYIQDNYQSLKQVVMNITRNHELADELFHYTLTIMLEYDQKKMDEIVNKKHAKFFFISILINQWNSSTSPFYKQYRKHNISIDENFDLPDNDEYDYEIDNKIDYIEEELSKEHWYTDKVVRMKAEMSYQEIKELTGIPRSSLFATVNKFRTKIKNNYKNI